MGEGNGQETCLPYRRLLEERQGRLSLPRPEVACPARLARDELDRIIAYLRAGRELNSWDGYSYCRFGCRDRFEDPVDPGVEDMGVSDLFDGVWIWPEGLAHYVERHSVRLPEEFVDHMRSCSWVVPDARVLWEVLVEDEEAEDVDHTFWIAWGKRETGGSAG
jgi:hypothetical protein